ncbi:hypothetical protein BG011_003894 [Mortierella polycephala]|uniref:Uncharacterized protein n=1 Tax=Mortierella polycephala TaxID=41804 RepID=A0A9P6Q1K6_9FUNG|nr:hypothetical protein BG011_003894 [Mortierella polycephala]
MQHTRSLATLLSRSTTGAVQQAPRIITAARIVARPHAVSIHTVSAQAEEEKRGFLSRLNPFAAKPSPSTTTAQSQETAAAAVEDLNVEIEEEEEPIPSWKSERQSMTPEQLEESIRSAAAPFVDSASGVYLDKIQLVNPKVKFQARHEIPSKELSSIHTLKDIHTAIQRLDEGAQSMLSDPKGHVVAEWFQKNKSALPPNMVFIPYEKPKGVKAEDRKSANKRFL